MRDEIHELREDVLNEEALIEETIKRLKQIRKRVSTEVADEMMEPALGTCLMNFYNGIENILKRICKVYYQSPVLRSPNWHKELLDCSYQPPSGKNPVLSRDVVERLYQYKNFRHRFISGYGFQLKLEKMLVLVENVEILWLQVKQEIDQFFKKVS